MNKQNSNFEVALTKCYFCGEGADIIINRLLTKKAAQQVALLHNQVISRELCPKCKEYMKQGIIVITFDDSKTPPNTSSTDDLYRDGGFYVIKDEAIEHLISCPTFSQIAKDALSKSLIDRVIFLPGEFFKKLTGKE